MDSSYDNFVARMGSFDDSLDIQIPDDELKHSKDNQELRHFGTKGMKWGRRKQGPPLPPSMKRERSINNLNKTKNAFNTTSKSLRTTNEALKSTTKKKEYDLSELTDADLKKRVERLNLEARYNQLAPTQVSKGREYLQSTLDVAGATLAVASTAVTLALAIKQLKGN